MNNNSTTSIEKEPSEIKRQDMTVDEYSKLIAKWQEAYYTWNVSCINYYKYLDLIRFLLIIWFTI